MTSLSPFSIHIFIADGDPDGLRVIERSNWVGKAIVFPRALLPDVKKRKELEQTGVYLLLGPRDDVDGEMIYIGEGDPVKPRLDNHYAQKDFWTRAVVFIAGPGQLNKAHVQYLESQLIRRAKAAKRMHLDNYNQPAEPSLSETDLAYMEVFLENMLGMLPVLGVQAFEEGRPKIALEQQVELICGGKGIIAKGYESTQGFVVRAGSQAVDKSVPSMEQHIHGIYELREELIRNGVLTKDGTKYTFSQDYVFSAPSTAAAVILGRSANGRIEWRNAEGRTLKNIQEQQSRE